MTVSTTQHLATHVLITLYDIAGVRILENFDGGLESYRGGAVRLMDFAHYFWPFRVFHYFLLKLQRERGRQNERTLGMRVGAFNMVVGFSPKI